MGTQTISYLVCDLCPDDTEATDVARLSLDGHIWEFDVCAEHKASLFADISRIGRRGTLVKEPGKTSRLALLQAAAPEPAPVPAFSSPPPKPSGELPVADYADSWQWTDHARQRLESRKITEWAALRCAQYPERVESSKKYRDCFIHYRGDLRVIVNPHTRGIITVTHAGEFVSPTQKAGSN